MIKTAEVYNPIYTDKEHFIILITGGRGCETPTQGVIMADLTVKQIKDIKEGDFVMGDDFTPRRVLGKVCGRAMMYKIHQDNAEDYIVSDSHTLSLFSPKGEIDIPLFEYMALSNEERAHLYGYKRERGRIAFSHIKVEQIGEGDYCGISLDGNQRYLHADGTVTHNSGKSFSASTFIERLTFELGKDESGERVNHQILYCRYTMVSAAVSVIPEFMEKIELDGTGKYFRTTRTDVTNRSTGARIMFRGIKTSSGNQTAKLKSIHGLTTLVCDEAEEWTDETDFERIMLSIRQKGIQNRIIIIMNPTDSNHFIYRKYIKNTHKIVEYDGVPVQISTHPNVLHIHTSYLDNEKHLADEFLKEIRTLKEQDPEKYAHVVMGQWADVAEGAIYKKWGVVKSFPEYAKKIAIGLDFGYACFRGDVLITTRRGDIPIKDVKVGDYVLTRKGWRRVKRNLYNGRKNVIEKRIKVGQNEYIVAATYEHNVNANGKWKKYGELTEGDKLFVLSPSTGQSIDAIQAASTRTITTTNTRKTGCGIPNYYTTRFTSFIRALFRKARSFTISIRTRSTTTSRISWRSLLRSIADFTKKKSKFCERIDPLTVDSQRRIGAKGEQKLPNGLQPQQDFARGAAQSTFQQIPISGSAQSNATTNGSTQPRSATFRWFANIVGKSLWVTNTLNRKRAANRALISWHGIKSVENLKQEECDVYDLEIDGVHEYFANGILVHNCDPSAAVRCGIVDNDLYIDELFYKKGMLSTDIARELQRFHGTFVYADSADPRLIDELMLSGVLIYPVQKGGGSILAGIQRILDFDNIFVTEHSYNVQNELRNYVWAKDKDGNYINKPEDRNNHCFVGETKVTTFEGEKRIDEIKVGDLVLTSQGYKRVLRVFDNGIKEVVSAKLTIDGEVIRLTATADHKIKTEGQWIELQKLKNGATVYRCKCSTESPSQRTNIHQQNIVQKIVVTNVAQPRELQKISITKLKRPRRVYDIEVEEAHEYFANGILVHNCMDAFRYWCLAAVLGKVIIKEKFIGKRPKVEPIKTDWI